MIKDYLNQIEDMPVVAMSIEQPGQDDVWSEIKLPILRAIMLAAIERFRQRADDAKDTTTLDWDDISVDILGGCLCEYQLNRFFEDKCSAIHEWLETVS